MAYIERELKVARKLDELFPDRGVLGHVCVQHDTWCPILRDAGAACLCKPDMLLLIEGERYEVDEAGELRKPARAHLKCHHGFEGK